MKDWQALKPLAGVLALFLAALLVFAALVAADRASLLIPSPENAAGQLVQALGAHRYAGAMGQLSQELQQQVDRNDLIALVEQIEASASRGIEDAHAVDSQEQGVTAAATVRVKLKNMQEQELQFALVKENGLWKVESLKPLESLIQ
jgi:hypothetical protein